MTEYKSEIDTANKATKTLEEDHMPKHGGRPALRRRTIVVIIFIFCIVAVAVTIKAIIPAVNYAKAEKVELL